MEYNFVEFRRKYQNMPSDIPYIKVNLNSIWICSALYKKEFKPEDKLSVFIDKEHSLIKIEKSENGRRITRFCFCNLTGIGREIPLGRYYQTKDKNIFKFKPNNIANKNN